MCIINVIYTDYTNFLVCSSSTEGAGKEKVAEKLKPCSTDTSLGQGQNYLPCSKAQRMAADERGVKGFNEFTSKIFTTPLGI